MMASPDLIGRARLLLRGLSPPVGSAQEVVALGALKFEDLMMLEGVTAVVAGAASGSVETAQKALTELQKRVLPELASRLEAKAGQAKKMLEELGGDVLVVEPTDGRPENVDVMSTPGSSFFRSVRRRQ